MIIIRKISPLVISSKIPPFIVITPLGGTRGTRSDIRPLKIKYQISDPPKIKYQMSSLRKKSDIWLLKKSDIRSNKNSIIIFVLIIMLGLRICIAIIFILVYIPTICIYRGGSRISEMEAQPQQSGFSPTSLTKSYTYTGGIFPSCSHGSQCIIHLFIWHDIHNELYHV